MKNIILVYTFSEREYWQKIRRLPLSFPVGVLSIATVLAKNNYIVNIIDNTIYKDYMRRLEEYLNKDTIFVGISTMTGGLWNALEVSKRVKELQPNVPVVWGGIHPTLYPEQTLKNPYVDFVVVGEGEDVAVELANALVNNLDYKNIICLGYKTNGEIKINKALRIVDLEKLPPMNYDLVNMNDYLYRDVSTFLGFSNIVKIVSLHTGRGCPFKCTFCITTIDVWNIRRNISVEKLIAEIDRIVEKFDPDVIYFQDENFFSDKKRTFKFFEICEAKKYKFKWIASSHSAYFNENYLSEKFCDKYFKNCINLQVGVESGSQRILNFIKKKTDLKKIEYVVKFLSKYNFIKAYAFMVGLPTETKEEMLETIRLILKIKKYDKNAFTTYQFYRPYPGAELYNLCIKMGFKEPQSVEEWIEQEEWRTGFLKVGELPWIKEPEFINKLFWMMTVLNIPKKAIPTILRPLYNLFSKWLILRFKLNFWALPLDFKLLESRFWKLKTFGKLFIKKSSLEN